MKFSEAIDDLLLEVSVYHPIPNFKKKEHLYTLFTVCRDKGYGYLIPTLKEMFLHEAEGAGEQSQSQKLGLVHLGGGYYGKKAGDTATHVSKDGKIQPITPAEADAINNAADAKAETPADPAANAKAEQDKAEKERQKKEYEFQRAKDDPDSVLKDPKATSHNKAMARSQQSANNLADVDKAKEDGGESDEKKHKDHPEGFEPVESEELLDKMPKANEKTFAEPSDIPNKVAPAVLEKFNTDIKQIADLVGKAKASGQPAPDINLCNVTVPGTNLYCDNNLGIPRDQMPQFKGKPVQGSRADDLPLDKSGEVDTEPIFREMLDKKKIKVLQIEIPADRLKATQSELVAAKVIGMMGALENDPEHPAITAPIYVSRDGYVIDGHHRWAAVVAYNASHPDDPIQMRTTVIDMDIKDAIPMANKFAEDMGVAVKKADANKEGGTNQKSDTTKTDTTDAAKKSDADSGYKEKTKSIDHAAALQDRTSKTADTSKEAPDEERDVQNNVYGKGKATDVKPSEEPTVTDDVIGAEATTTSGKRVYHIGGGYYSDSPNGEAKYIRVESVVNNALETDLPKWWNMLFEGTITANTGSGKILKLKDIKKGEEAAATIAAANASDDVIETEEAAEIDLSKLAKTAKNRESALGDVDKRKIEKEREKYKEKIKSIKDKRLRLALERAINGETLTKDEKALLKKYVRIVEPTSKKPNAFKIYVATEPGNFGRKAEPRASSIEISSDSETGAIVRDVMGSNGVENIATSAFGGKKTTAGQIYVDPVSGKTKLLDKPGKDDVEVDKSGKIKSIKFGNTTLDRLDENEKGISQTEKTKRERSNRNLDEFGTQIQNGTLKFVDTDSGKYPDTTENRAFIIKDSLAKMHDKLYEMAKKAGATSDSEAMQLLERLKRLSTLDPNENPEEWYKEYNKVFHAIAESEDEPKLGEAWANIAEIWVTLGELHGNGKGTEQGIVALLPESTTLETVDVIKLGKTTNDANRTIVTIDGISVKKEAGGASAMVPKMRKTSFKNVNGNDAKEFKDEITGFGARGAAKIYGYPNSLDEAKNECARWDDYGQPAKDGKKKKKPKISSESCAVVNNFKNETDYAKHIANHQSDYQKEMLGQSQKWEKDGRLPKGYGKALLADMETQTKKGGMIYNALESIKEKNPLYKKMSPAEKKLWESQISSKLKNYYFHVYITHAAYNQNVESQDFENDSVYTQTDKKTGEGKINIHKSDGIGTLSFMNPTFNIGWSASGAPSNFAAGRLVPLDKDSPDGRSYGLINTPDSGKEKPKTKGAVKKSKKLEGLHPDIKKRVLERLRSLRK